MIYIIILTLKHQKILKEEKNGKKILKRKSKLESK